MDENPQFERKLDCKCRWPDWQPQWHPLSILSSHEGERQRSPFFVPKFFALCGSQCTQTAVASATPVIARLVSPLKGGHV